MERWHLRSRAINEVVHATSALDACDQLHDRPAEDFGLIVLAEPNESGDPYPIRTSLLMFRLGRDADAKRFIELGIQEGCGDTTAADLEAAGRLPLT